MHFSNITFRLKFSVFILLFIIFYIPVLAQDYADELGTSSSNDFYISKFDRYYTNGNHFFYRHAFKYDSLGNYRKKILELETGQKIFNPFFAKAPDPSTHDRPFTAYLYAGGSLKWHLKTNTMFGAGIQLGYIGPKALGKEIQTSYHNFLGVFKPAGWDYQLNNEFGVNLSFDYNQQISKTKSNLIDIHLLSRLNIGNTFSGFDGGLLFRIGKFNEMFNSSSFNSNINNQSNLFSSSNHKELFIFYKPNLSFVAYNATIQGGMFIKDKGPVTFGVKPFVLTQDLGVNYASKRWTTSFFITFKSNEVKSNAVAYSYATWLVSYRLNTKLMRF